ncbi:IS4 family transposase [Thiorhodovibrio frisius]|uniref:Transposase family protein n=1 Tax=Thiorhodovibrio frisius TaxID=631362 RepID=H8Z2P5_9GAMM|nr:IS4 family transposase [Thiorhodovibrio frisius]EIC22738.1 transposase family protein [Thiorhodovibrio frisius]WPL22494.1 Transposase for transposon Tn5 [Thiorhodovibrio frisius]
MMAPESKLASELQDISLGDRRLNHRAQQLIETLGAKPTQSIPGACNGWDETRAAYRFFDHDRATAKQVLAPHVACTQARLREHPRVLCIQDTSELDYTTKKGIAGLGPLNFESRYGMYIHPTLALTPERVALGLLDLHTFTREPGSLGQDKDPLRPLEEKESVRWVDGYGRVNELAETLTDTRLTYIADREGDIYDLFVEAPIPENSADWLVRVQHRDRCLADGRKLNEALDAAPVLTEITFERPATKGAKARQVEQEVKVVRVTLKAPRRPDRTLADVTVTALLATEVNPPAGEEPLNWLLLTNMAVETAEQAIEKLSWYLCRWQVEIFFRILKSGCRIEELQLETRERLEPALAFYMIIAWRVLHLTMLGRECPELPCDAVFAEEEWKAVYLVTQRQAPPEQPPSLDTIVRMVASLGGFLNRKSDGFPGPKTLWIGLQRIPDFVMALEAYRSVGDSYG